MHYIKQFKTKWMIPKTQTKPAVLHTSYNPNEAENSFAEVCTDFLSCRSFNPQFKSFFDVHCKYNLYIFYTIT